MRLPESLQTLPEPCRFISDREVHAAVTENPSDYLDWLRNALLRIAQGTAHLVLPNKTIYPNQPSGGDFRVMTCILSEGSHRRQTVKLVGTNRAQRLIPGQITVGKAFLIDQQENHISHIFDGCLLSSARTGACAALAVSFLGQQPSHVQVVGAGKVGFYCAVYLSTLPGVEKMTIVDRQSDRARALHAHLESRLSHIRLAHTERIVGASDVVVLATDSYQPLLGRQNNPAQLVISLGADTLDQAELEDDWAALPVIHTDSRDSLNYGDLARWHRQGALRPEQLADLLDLVRDPPPKTGEQRLFVSTGTALFDNLTIGYLLRNP